MQAKYKVGDLVWLRVPRQKVTVRAMVMMASGPVYRVQDEDRARATVREAEIEGVVTK